MYFNIVLFYFIMQVIVVLVIFIRKLQVLF